MNDVVAVYADGGVLLHNPSVVGGLFAACHVDASGWRVAEFSGVLPVQTVGGLITNNDAEFFALLAGLEPLPDGWSGTVYSDSEVTLRRFRRLYAERKHTASTVLLSRHIPVPWGQRAFSTVARLDALDFVHLKGHPTRAQVRRGVDGLGRLVSEHQVWCDEACTREGQEYMKRRALLGRLAAA